MEGPFPHLNQRSDAMRFLILTNAGKTNEAHMMPSELTAAGRSGEALAKAEGRYPFSPAARVRFSAHKMSVVDGPFPETKQ
jgi:hypothetical protein